MLLRLLHGWHLLSLDAATVAFCWTLLFERCVGARRPVPAALALACAVWLIYAADRVLDAAVPHGGSGALHSLYRQHRARFVVVGAAVAVFLSALLTLVAREVVVAWALLAVPLGMYGLAVHGAGLPSRWKPGSIGVFFAAAVAVPCLVAQPGEWCGVLCAALLFGELCRQNCTVLQRGGLLTPVAVVYAAAGMVVAASARTFLPAALACVAACALLLWLSRRRDQFHPLTFRALADAALVAPVLVWLVR